ncbi:MAG TPA: 4Fe-4S dicluster domain-containing protein [Armatimonadota bacterium]|jgi:NAD-dependent dihydropyrimidine dehydrogenase PreA subunit
MKTYLLPKDQLNDWLLRVKAQRTLFAPLADAAGVLDWREVSDPAQIVLAPGVPELPLKKLFFPPSEVMLRFGYRSEQAAVAAVAPPAEPFAVFGVRPCDALATQVADLVFLAGLPDPYYQARREAGLIISVNCAEPAPECFCASLNNALTEAPGSDVLLTPLGEQFLLEALTDQGEALLAETAAGLAEGGEADLAAKAEAVAQTAAQQMRRVDLEGLTERVRRSYGDEAFWKSHTEACIGCGVCTFLCPTCTCFDVRDDAVSGRGQRFRCWDTCQFADFSKEASGHDARAQQWQKQRNRVCHKFWYSVDRCGVLSCVGCGRCLRGCAGHSDIVEMLADLNKEPVTADE